MQYLLMIYSDESLQNTMTPAEKGAYFQAYGTFTAELKAANRMVAGDALLPVSMATTVRVRNNRTVTTDGPFAETKEQLGGYYLIEADNLDDAIHWASRMPTATHGTIEVRPLMVFETP